MDPATIQLIIQLVVLAEEEIPQAILLVRKIKKAIAHDPVVNAQLNADTAAVSAEAKDTIRQWRTEHGITS